MPAANTRITITPTSEAHTVLLNYWAGLEGRTLSNLCSSLLENAINEAISKRTVNPQALEMMNEFINVRRNQLKIEYGRTLSKEQEKVENYLNEISAQASEDPENETKFNQWSSLAEEAWAKSNPPNSGNFNVSELYKYEPDLGLITSYIKKWNLSAKSIPEASKILTKASMAGLNFLEIEKAIDNIIDEFMTEYGYLHDEKSFLATLKQICDVMIQSKKLSLPKDLPF